MNDFWIGVVGGAYFGGMVVFILCMELWNPKACKLIRAEYMVRKRATVVALVLILVTWPMHLVRK